MPKKFKLHFNLIPIILITILLLKIVFSIEIIFNGVFSTIFSILVPFFWAFGIAYLLNPLMLLLEKKLKLKRSLSILLTYIITLVLITFLFMVIVPTILSSLSDLTKNISTYMNTAEVFIAESLSHIDKSSPGLSAQIQSGFLDVFKFFAEKLTGLAGSMVGQTIELTSSFIKFIFGFIISIYMLSEKDNLITYLKKAVLILLPKEKANFVLDFFSESNSLFGRFIVGKTIDSTIIGILCYIGLVLLKAPFAVLIAIIVGITNMIPYFGPFIGMIPAFLLTLFVSPSKAIIVVLFILLLQQFDGWYLGPKILGDKVGVSPLLIIFAVTVGGGIGGVLGMFISVPIIALVRNYVNKYLKYRADQKEKGKIEI